MVGFTHPRIIILIAEADNIRPALKREFNKYSVGRLAHKPPQKATAG